MPGTGLDFGKKEMKEVKEIYNLERKQRIPMISVGFQSIWVGIVKECYEKRYLRENLIQCGELRESLPKGVMLELSFEVQLKVPEVPKGQPIKGHSNLRE